MNFSDYAACDATALAELIANREVSASEVADAARGAIETLNPSLNAVLATVEDQPYDNDGPFSGVPFLIKELIIQARGAPCRAGSRAQTDALSSADDSLMQRFRGAGLHLIGTTQTPEFGYNATTEPQAFGPAHNPWQPGFSPGGSSGGSGAAVAAGMVPIAHANDGGGSIRIPASCNGLVGLKPSRDRIPSGPYASDPLLGHAIDFAVTRSVRDSATLLDSVAGPDTGAPHLIQPPNRHFSDWAGASPVPCRVAFLHTTPFGTPLHEECEQALRRTRNLLQDLGHDIDDDFALQLDFDEFTQNIHRIWCTSLAATVTALSRRSDHRPDTDKFEAVTLACAEDGRRMSALDLLASLDYVNRISRMTASAFATIDVLVTTTLATPPAQHGHLNQNDPTLSAMDWTRQTFEYAPNTPLFNSTGQPAISLPLHWSADGLPVGVQLVAALGEEGLLLNLAAQLEDASGWRAHQQSLIERLTP